MIKPYLSIFTNLSKYMRFKASFSQYKELCEMTSNLQIPKLSNTELKAINQYFAEYSPYKINPAWHAFYAYLNGFDKRYIPIDFLFSYIIPALNKSKWSDGYVDKNRYTQLFPTILQPKTFFKRINGDYYIEDKIVKDDEAIALALSVSDAIIKPSIETGQGKGVSLFNGTNIEKNKISEFLDSHGKNFIVQEKIQAHPVISNLNPTSLNTIRMVTYRKGPEVFVLSSTMKIGKKGEVVDNGHSGGVFCGIKDGILGDTIYSLNPFSASPLESIVEHTKKITLPNYNKLVKAAKELALQLPYSRYAGWDLSIDSNGDPILIEVNLSCPGGNIMQIPNGPLFGEMSNEILQEIKYIYKK